MDLEHHSMHIPKWKKDEIRDIKSKIRDYPVVGLVGIHGLPSKQFQQMRSSIRDSVLIKVCKNSLITRALDESSEDIKPLRDYLDHETGLVFSNDNSFKLFRLLSSSKTPAPIKGGMTSPRDITVEKGPTNFPPGPIIGELQSAGIPAAIEGGKVVIRETKVVAKEGEVVSQNLAAMLARLDIYPLELGLVLRCTFEDGMLFDASKLAIDEGKISLDFTTAASQAFNLAVNSAYPTSTTIQALLAKAASESRNLAVNAVIYEPGVMDILLSRAQGHVMALAGLVSDEALDDDLKAKMSAGTAVSPVVVEPGEEETASEVEEEAAEEETEETAAEGLGALFG